mmetsp:Transcript_38424/g.83597  ORF Transcript_38424/g.83597 Transcript_38424/m.83597 type:complete len:228 (+) Transcript_38424:2285-2968(+)
MGPYTSPTNRLRLASTHSQALMIRPWGSLFARARMRWLRTSACLRNLALISPSWRWGRAAACCVSVFLYPSSFSSLFSRRRSTFSRSASSVLSSGSGRALICASKSAISARALAIFASRWRAVFCRFWISCCTASMLFPILRRSSSTACLLSKSCASSSLIAFLALSASLRCAILSVRGFLAICSCFSFSFIWFLVLLAFTRAFSHSSFAISNFNHGFFFSSSSISA